MISWSKRLDAAVRRVAGPEDEIDESVNCDPDSTLGEDVEEGEFEEMHDWPDEDDEEDDGDEDC